MKCPSCSKIIKKTDKTCRFCGIDIIKNDNEPIIKTQVIYKTIENKANRWLILAVGILSFLVILETSFFIWYFFINKPIKDTKKNIEDYNYQPILPYDIYNTNEEFEFNNLFIKVSSNYEIITLDNNFSIHNGKKVLKIPVSITNKTDEDHPINIFYYDIYDDNGNNIDEVAGYFDESLYYAEDLKKNSSFTKYIYALYYGNKAYSIKIGNKEKTIYIKYNIKNNLT